MNVPVKMLWVWLAVVLTTGWVWPVPTAAEDRRGASRVDASTPAADDDDDDEDETPRPQPRREDPRTMTPADWRALARKVATNLQWLGLQMGANPQELQVFVPIFTNEYLQAFRVALMQGATKPQADILASQHTYALIQRLAQQSGGGGGGGDGCHYSRGGTFCSGRDGFRDFTFR